MRAPKTLLLAAVVTFLVAGSAIGRSPESRFDGPLLAPQGTVVLFTDRPTFDAAAPGLPIEDWEEFLVAPMGSTPCDAPANNTTSCAGVYLAGDILPGLELNDDPGPDLLGLRAAGSGFNGNPSLQFGNATTGEALIVSFSPVIDAAGMDVSCHLNDSTNIGIEVFDAMGVSLESMAFPCSNAGVFIGVTSTTPIASIRLLAAGANLSLIDNVAFGDITIPVELTGFSVE